MSRETAALILSWVVLIGLYATAVAVRNDDLLFAATGAAFAVVLAASAWAARAGLAGRISLGLCTALALVSIGSVTMFSSASAPLRASPSASAPSANVPSP